eukprot:334806-Amphidinium_carterae.1
MTKGGTKALWEVRASWPVARERQAANSACRTAIDAGLAGPPRRNLWTPTDVSSPSLQSKMVCEFCQSSQFMCTFETAWTKGAFHWDISWSLKQHALLDD